MTCDICGPDEKKQISSKVVSHDPFVECLKLECGHQWHIHFPASGDLGHHHECDCLDYKRP